MLRRPFTGAMLMLKGRPGAADAATFVRDAGRVLGRLDDESPEARLAAFRDWLAEAGRLEEAEGHLRAMEAARDRNLTVVAG